MPIDAAKIAELRALLAKATPGPWENEGVTVYAINDSGTNRFSATVQAGFTFQQKRAPSVSTTLAEAQASAALIVAMRNALPDLLDLTEANLKGGGANAIVRSQPATSPGVTAGASAGRIASACALTIASAPHGAKR